MGNTRIKLRISSSKTVEISNDYEKNGGGSVASLTTKMR